MKKLKLLFLPFLLCLFCVFPLGCNEKEPTGSKGLEFIENVGGKSYAVQNIGTCDDEKVVIPKTYKGKPVTRVYDRAFKGADTIEEVVLPEGLLYIDKLAFSECINLQSVKIPSTVKELGGSSFAGCENLQSVTFAKGCVLEKIGGSSFDGCTSLTEFEVPSSVQEVGSYAFQNCTALEEITFLEGATYSPETYAQWNGCVNLKKAYLPGTFQKMSWATFQGCTSLEIVFVGTKQEFATLDRYYNRNSNGPFWAATHYIYSEEEPRESGRFWHYVKGKMTIWE